MKDNKYLKEYDTWLDSINEDDVIRWVRAVFTAKFDEIKGGAFQRMIMGDKKFGTSTFEKSREEIQMEAEEEIMDFINYNYMIIKK